MIGPIPDYDCWKLANREDEDPDDGFSDPRYDEWPIEEGED